MTFLFRFRYQEQGGHTHVRLFAGPDGGTLGKCGDVVFRNEEWAEFKETFTSDARVEFKEEEDYG